VILTDSHAVISLHLNIKQVKITMMMIPRFKSLGKKKKKEGKIRKRKQLT